MTTKAIKWFDGTYHDFLSNFHPGSVLLDGFEYPTVEHAYQAAKCADSSDRTPFKLARSPGLAKRMGQSVKLRGDWEGVKTEVMHGLVRQKFTRHPHLTRMLMATGDAHLEEGNNWNDRVWGTVDGVGENRLGVILMRVRHEIRAQPSAV
jgi:hypothetical protein